MVFFPKQQWWIKSWMYTKWVTVSFTFPSQGSRFGTIVLTSQLSWHRGISCITSLLFVDDTFHSLVYCSFCSIICGIHWICFQCIKMKNVSSNLRLWLCRLSEWLQPHIFSAEYFRFLEVIHDLEGKLWQPVSWSCAEVLSVFITNVPCTFKL